MAYAHVASVGSSGKTGHTSGSIDTTGATILIGALAYAGTGAGNFSDSKGNTWTALTQTSTAGDRSLRLFVAVNPVVGTGHTFSTTTGVSALGATAWSGADTSAPTDQENGGTATTSTSCSSGAITPSVNDCLVISACLLDVNATASAAGFTNRVVRAFVGGTSYGLVLGSVVQTTAASVTGSWTVSVASNWIARITSFLSAGGAPVSPRAHTFTLMGVM